MSARDADLRASQQERERTVERLRAHAGDGRLELDELEQRVEAALAARTRGELDALLADLPREPRRPERRTRVARAWLPLLAGIAILALAPHGVAWVGWVVIGWWFFAGMPSAGLGFASCGHARRRRRAVPV
jgi:Domain of unknown function (DUF1707)